MTWSIASRFLKRTEADSTTIWETRANPPFAIVVRCEPHVEGPGTLTGVSKRQWNCPAAGHPFPWEEEEPANLIFSLVESQRDGVIETVAEMASNPTRNRWLWTPRLSRKNPLSMLRQQFTDIAIDTTPSSFLTDKESLKVTRQLAREVQGWQPQRRVRIWIALRAESLEDMRLSERACQLAFALGASGVRILGQSPALGGTVHAIRSHNPQADCEQTTAFKTRPWD